MKRRILILVFTLFISYCFAQNISQRNVPAVVLNSFQVTFPNADDVSWMLKNGNYQVKCKVNNKRNEVIMDYRGRMINHRQNIYVSEIPKPVFETLRSKGTSFDVTNAEKVVENGKIIYEIDYRSSGKRQSFWINQMGHLLKYRKELNDDEIPASITNYIKAKYPPFDRIDWARYIEENGKSYYTVAGRGHVFFFDDTLNVFEHHQDLQESNIPPAIMKTIKQSYNGYDIKDADMIDKRGVVTYIIRLRKSGKDVFATLNPEGRILYVK